MRKFGIVAALLLAMGAPAAAQAPASGSGWSVAGERLRFPQAGISVPRHAGTVDHYETREFSHAGEGLDTVLQWRSTDHAVFASLYVYYPSIAHAGLQEVATDAAIQANPKGGGIPLRSGSAAVAGKPGLALTAAYRGYMGELFSTSAFVKAGRWMVKVRVSGPEAREAEVSAVLTALLDGLSFEGAVQPRPAAALDITECAAAPDRDARVLRDKDSGLEGALIAVFDAAGDEGKDEHGARKLLPPRIGQSWCRSNLEVGDARIPMLRAVAGGSGDGLGGRSELFVLYSDAGGMFEVVGLTGKKKYVLIDHEIGEAKILATFDGVPSRRQLAELFAQPGDLGRVRASVRVKPDGNTEINLVQPEKGHR
jgi:hypothetical protein